MQKVINEIEKRVIKITQSGDKKSIEISDGVSTTLISLAAKTINARDIFSVFFNHGIYVQYSLDGNKITAENGRSLDALENLYNDCYDLFSKLVSGISLKANELVSTETSSAENEPEEIDESSK